VSTIPHSTTHNKARGSAMVKQAATAAEPHVSPWHEPTLEAERILMVDFASNQARAKKVAPSASREGDQIVADGVDKMYHQLAEIHIITTMQLAECARWR
jgi:hypothetical protein